jgi:hypothetical protein
MKKQKEKVREKGKENNIINWTGDRSFLGIFIVIFGLIILLSSLNIVSINVDIRLIWPIFVIFLGLSLFTRKDSVSLMVGSVISFIVIVLLCISLFQVKPIVENKETSMPIVVSQEMEIEKAKIEINAGMGDISLYGSDTPNLIEGSILSNFAKAVTNSSITDNVQEVKLDINGDSDWKSAPKNELKLGLNKDSLIDLFFNSGASSNSLDLSEVKAENINISTGASSLNLKVGDKVNSNILIEAGASSIVISLPKTMQGKIIFESALSSKDMNGFDYVGDNVYKTSKYDSSENKIDIDIKAGMASIVINWYEPVIKEEVSLFYYQASADKEVSCDSDFVLPVTRNVVKSENTIKDTIELLLKGELNQAERDAGFQTEFPNQDFKLNDYNLNDKGVLTLTFTEVPGFTTGGSCRVGLLSSQIIKTAKQFSQVKKVVLEPESLFQP